MAIVGLEEQVIEDILELVAVVCNNPRIVLGGGGNFSIKDHEKMLIKASGTALTNMSVANMALLDRITVREALEHKYSDIPSIRESEYKDFLMRARVDPNGPRPSVETAVHELFPKYVLHSHPTALTALSCVKQGPEILSELFPQYKFAIMEYLDPGILLGLTAKDIVDKLGYVPDGIMQKNHGMFFASSDLGNLIKMHNHVVKEVENYITYASKQNLVMPFGDKTRHIYKYGREEDAARATYKKLFNESTVNIAQCELEDGFTVLELTSPNNPGVVMFAPNPQSYNFACSYMARHDSNRFSWLSPDHIVSLGMNTDYVYIHDHDENIEAIKNDVIHGIRYNKNGLYSRAFIIDGIGIATAGGHIASDTNPSFKAKMAMQFIKDALLVYQAASVIGDINMLTEDNARFIDTWEVEAARRSQMQK